MGKYFVCDEKTLQNLIKCIKFYDTSELLASITEVMADFSLENRLGELRLEYPDDIIIAGEIPEMAKQPIIVTGDIIFLKVKNSHWFIIKVLGGIVEEKEM